MLKILCNECQFFSSNFTCGHSNAVKEAELNPYFGRDCARKNKMNNCPDFKSKIDTSKPSKSRIQFLIEFFNRLKKGEIFKWNLQTKIKP